MIDTILNFGYQHHGFGYRLIIGDIVHWITVFESKKVQMYGFHKHAEEEEPFLYDTGIIELELNQLFTFLTVFTNQELS